MEGNWFDLFSFETNNDYNGLPGCKPETSLDSHDPEKVISNFSSHILSDLEKSLPCKCLWFDLPPKKIDYADFLLQFELLYCDTL